MKKLMGVILVLFFSQNIFGQWITVNERYSTVAQDTISTIYWKDSSIVFAGGKNNMLLKSENGGVNWSYSNSGINQSANSKDVTNIEFFNSTTGFACTAYLYKTTNAGNNWNVVSNNYFETYILVDENIVYAITTVGSQRILYKSTTGGIDWVPMNPLLVQTSKIIFLNENTGYCRAGEDNVYKTTNSGVNWVAVWNSSTLYSFEFQDVSKGIVLLNNGISTTSNGGQTWGALNPSPGLWSCNLYRNDTIIYSSVYNLFFSSNNGATYTIRDIVLPFPAYLYQATYSFWNRNNGLFAGGKRIFKTTDFGATFTDVGKVTGDYTTMNSIHMFNADEIFIATDLSVWKTTNGGTNWGKFNQDLSLSQIQFINYNSGFALTSDPRVKYTVDHGDSWLSLPVLPNLSGPLNKSYNLLRIFNNSFIVAGATSRNAVAPGHIYYYNDIYITANSGTNWYKILTAVGDDPHDIGDKNRHWYEDIFFTNDNTGYCILNDYVIFPLGSGFAEGSHILKTTNRGNNWTDILNEDSTQGGKIFFQNENTGFVSLFSHHPEYTNTGIFKTTNAGVNWTRLTNFYSNKFIITDPNTAFSYDGYASSDGGATWVSQFTPYSPNAIQFINNYTGFIVGNEGVIYKTTNAGGLNVGITQTSSSVPDKFNLHQNYPNPFNPSTKINYEIKSSGFVSLKVFDLLGKEVASLVNEKQNAGSYAVDFNSTEFNLPSGIYFYTLNAGAFNETRKMILIK